jgi:uncharacterized membrane protein
MSATLILLARVVHILGGIVWVGTMFTVATTILPIGAKHGAEGAGRWVGMITRKLGPTSGIAAVLTIISGGYLMAIIHPHNTTPGGIVLMAGAAAALLAFVVGFFFARPAAMKVGALNMQHAGAEPRSAEIAQEIAALQRRAAVSTKVTVVFLVLAVLAMACFRYVQLVV